jgi:hypothetical protein
MIYRAKDGPKQEWADQTITIDLFLNSTQCSFDPRLWKEEPSRKWFAKRNRFSFGANFSNPESFYSVPNMRGRCESLREQKKAVCSKEIRLLGHVGALLSAASERDIPFSLVYQMRDPRASVLSQVSNVPHLKWSQHEGGLGSNFKFVEKGDLSKQNPKPCTLKLPRRCGTSRT